MHNGSENLPLVQLATLLAASTARSDHRQTNTAMFRIAGRILNLIERRCAGLSAGARLLLAIHTAQIVADWMVANDGETCRINDALLQIAAEDISLIDSHTGVEWRANGKPALTIS